MILKVLNRGLTGEQQRGEADYIGGPDHGLNVEGWPAIRCHSHQLYFTSDLLNCRQFRL